MNSRILTFIIGILTGAIIMTLVFMFFVPGNGGGQVHFAMGSINNIPNNIDIIM